MNCFECAHCKIIEMLDGGKTPVCLVDLKEITNMALVEGLCQNAEKDIMTDAQATALLEDIYDEEPWTKEDVTITEEELERKHIRTLHRWKEGKIGDLL